MAHSHRVRSDPGGIRGPSSRQHADWPGKTPGSGLIARVLPGPTVLYMGTVFGVEVSCPGGRISWQAFCRGRDVSSRYYDGEQAGPNLRTFSDADQAAQAMQNALHAQVHRLGMHINFSADLDDQGADWWRGGGVEMDFVASWEQASSEPFASDTTRPTDGQVASAVSTAGQIPPSPHHHETPTGALVLFAGLSSSHGGDRTAEIYRRCALDGVGVAGEHDDLVLAWVPQADLLGTPWKACRTELADYLPDAPLARPQLVPPAWYLSLGQPHALHKISDLHVAVGLMAGRSLQELRNGRAMDIVAATERLARNHGR